MIRCSSTFKINSASSVCVKKPTEMTLRVSNSWTIRQRIFLGKEVSDEAIQLFSVLQNQDFRILHEASCGSPTDMVFHAVGVVPSNSVAISKDIFFVSNHEGRQLKLNHFLPTSQCSMNFCHERVEPFAVNIILTSTVDFRDFPALQSSSTQDRSLPIQCLPSFHGTVDC